MPVIGFLDAARPGAARPSKPLDIAFRHGLFELVSVEAANVEIAYRYDAQTTRSPRFFAVRSSVPRNPRPLGTASFDTDGAAIKDEASPGGNQKFAA